MKSAKAQSALKSYGKVGVQAGGAYATPHRLITMLLEGALEKIAQAKGFMVRGEIPEKGSYISWAISIIEGLRISLDAEKGEDIAANLEALYDFMERRLVEANIQNSPEILDEVSGLLHTIKDAWTSIPENIKSGNTGPAQDGESTPNIKSSV